MNRPVMERLNLTRRSLIQAIAGVLATAAAPLDWTDVAQAMEAARARRAGRADAKLSFLSAAEAVDIEAVAAQIIPTDDSPGAREAGVVYFIDRALATFFSQLAGDYRAQLAAFQADIASAHPAVSSFASLTSDQQIEYLKGVDQTPFFATTRLLTLLGMFRCLNTAATATASAGSSSGSRTCMSFARRSATTTATIPASSSTQTIK